MTGVQEPPGVCCARCGSGAILTTLPSASADRGPVRATVDPHVIVNCAGGCGTIDGLAGAAAVDLAVSQSLRFGRGRPPRCADCTTALDLPLRVTTRAVTVEPPDAPPYTLTFTLPVVRCGGCGVDNVPPELERDVLGSAHQAAGTRTVPRGRLRRLLRRRPHRA